MTLASRLLAATNGGGGLIYPGHEFDDEFDGPNVDWFLPSGNAGLVTFDDDAPGKVYMPSGTRIHRVSVPTPPFTVTARCTSLLYDDIDAYFGNASLAIGAASPADDPGGKHYALQWDIAFLGEIGVIDGVWDQYSDTPTHLNGYVKLGDGATFEVPHWQRMVVHSGTNIDTYYSLDGVNWTTYAIGTNPGVSVGAVLLLSYACETTWDWVRFT